MPSVTLPSRLLGDKVNLTARTLRPFRSSSGSNSTLIAGLHNVEARPLEGVVVHEDVGLRAFAA